ncbi:MAG: hypothetical protein RL745_50 [Actinomycetota bacterium]
MKLPPLSRHDWEHESPVALRLPESWVWDCWFAFDGEYHHAFYLRASRGLYDPERRHHHTYIGHSRSRDLVTWETLPDALAPSEAPAFDDWTTWTGSVIRDDSGRWHMYYTGRTRADGGHIQRIVRASSDDLIEWQKDDAWVLQADDTWYEVLEDGVWTDVTWRDPWMFKSSDGNWKMYVTARHDSGDTQGRGAIGLAISKDLDTWQVMPPASANDCGFAQMEVLQSEIVDGVPVLLWCVGFNEVADDLKASFGAGGVFSAVGKSIEGPFDIRGASRFPHDSLYAARLVQHQGTWFLIGFRNYENGQFIGELCDPIPVTATTDAGLIPR